MYLQEMAYPHLTLSEDQFYQLFRAIDVDGDGSVVKEEMALFVKRLMEQQENLDFKRVDEVDLVA